MPYSTDVIDNLAGAPLTRRELEILALLADGNSTSAIAARLGLSPATIKSHLRRVYRKIGAHNRVQAVRHYLGLLASPQQY
jgi:LuxR family transcriptional regulator, maltose regulon positive regulatory protein